MVWPIKSGPVLGCHVRDAVERSQRAGGYRGPARTLPLTLRAPCVLASVYASYSAMTCVSPSTYAGPSEMRGARASARASGGRETGRRFSVGTRARPRLSLGSGSDDGQVAGEKDLTEVASSAVMSKTAYSFVICNKACTLLVRLSSFS